MYEAPPSSEEIRESTKAWWIVALIGLISAVIGIVVIAKPSNSLSTLAVITGIFVLVDGIVAIVESLLSHTENRGLMAILGVVSVVIGILLIRHPISGVRAVALLLGIWLIAAAVVRLVVAFSVAEHRARRLVVAAILAIAGIAIVSSPDIGYATLALILGIGLIASGIANIVLGLAIRAVGHTASRPATPPGAATA